MSQNENSKTSSTETDSVNNLEYVIIIKNTISSQSQISLVISGDPSMVKAPVVFEKLLKAGIIHVTALDSIAYHVKEGEMDEESGKEDH